jgi:PAS domain S-box-containing protein
MTAFGDIPIRQKLVIIIMVTTGAALAAAGLGFVAADSLLFRGYLRRDLTALSRMIGDNSTAALAFNDPETAAETLAALRARPHVVGACINRTDGTIIARYSREGVFDCPPADEAATARESVSAAPTGLLAVHPIFLSGRRIGTLMLAYDLGEISERTMLYGSTVLGVLLASSLLAFVLSSRLRRVIATPISQLVEATTAVSETGDYSTRARKLSGDELGVLVDRFNEMLAGIQARDRDLKAERERFRFMAESMPQKIFTAKANGDVDYFNRQWMEFTGLGFEQIRDWGWTQFVHPEDLEENLRLWRHSIETGEPFHYEHRFRRADGKYCWHLSRVRAMRDGSGNISMWIGSNTDIDDQKEKEAALRRANEDLQQFAYSASHDLQEPIRNVAVYSEIVARRYHGRLDAEGQQFLGFLREGGRRLATLINDLLAYTRAGATEAGEGPVDSSAVLEQTISDLAEAIRESNAEVTFDPLPEVHIGGSHLQQVFQNLITNALKYRDESPPRIHISAAPRGTLWCFCVQDNGIGIDPQYKEKIFGVFKRLNYDRKYAGTGIGLAICQRVIERYGGRIWVESEQGRGAAFYFTVPSHAPATRSASESSGG